ncbi:MAG: exodeoxyribonuclease VII large subunit, partial [Lachnospiraceae bacterium]|nr:exodeoxyribonuclease VII large subunit [Lachnospiraceae bacterium]
LLATTLDELSPLKKMTEGYTYTEKTDGAHIHSIKDVKYGDELKVHFKDGFAGVTVHDTEEVTR